MGWGGLTGMVTFNAAVVVVVVVVVVDVVVEVLSNLGQDDFQRQQLPEKIQIRFSRSCR